MTKRSVCGDARPDPITQAEIRSKVAADVAKVKAALSSPGGRRSLHGPVSDVRVNAVRRLEP